MGPACHRIDLPDDILDVMFDCLFPIGVKVRTLSHSRLNDPATAWEQLGAIDKLDVEHVKLAATLCLVSRRFRQTVSPLCIAVLMPNAELRTKMIFRVAIDAAASKRRVTPADYTLMYRSVYKCCTQKHPFNQSERIYKALRDHRSLLSVLSPENKTRAILFLEHVFKYLDRFYVKRVDLWPLKELLSKEVD